jgi:hypothetical protein
MSRGHAEEGFFRRELAEAEFFRREPTRASETTASKPRSGEVPRWNSPLPLMLDTFVPASGAGNNDVSPCRG